MRVISKLDRYSVVCLTPYALSPDALSPDALSPDALGPCTLSLCALSPCAFSPNGLRYILKNEASKVEFSYESLSKTVFLISFIKETCSITFYYQAHFRLAHQD